MSNRNIILDFLSGRNPESSGKFTEFSVLSSSTPEIPVVERVQSYWYVKGTNGCVCVCVCVSLSIWISPNKFEHLPD